eukprot:scaffold1.g5415.t1
MSASFVEAHRRSSSEEGSGTKGWLRLQARAAVATGLLAAVVLLAAARPWLVIGAPAPPPPAGAGLELVVAHHSEALHWLQPLLAALPPGVRAIIYSKGTVRPPGAVRLPNVGRETHTFLRHLAHRYDDLANVTLFLMGSADASSDKRAQLQSLLLNWPVAARHGFFCPLHERRSPRRGFQLAGWRGSTDAEWHALAPASPRPLSAWFAEHVGGPWPCTWCATSMMAVSRERVHQRPRAFYQHLLLQTAAGEVPEAGHFLERSWVGVFRHPDPQRCMPPIV